MLEKIQTLYILQECRILQAVPYRKFFLLVFDWKTVRCFCIPSRLWEVVTYNVQELVSHETYH